VGRKNAKRNAKQVWAQGPLGVERSPVAVQYNENLLREIFDLGWSRA
jgi:hypothetical protein